MFELSALPGWVKHNNFIYYPDLWMIYHPETGLLSVLVQRGWWKYGMSKNNSFISFSKKQICELKSIHLNPPTFLYLVPQFCHK